MFNEIKILQTPFCNTTLFHSRIPKKKTDDFPKGVHAGLLYFLLTKKSKFRKTVYKSSLLKVTFIN